MLKAPVEIKILKSLLSATNNQRHCIFQNDFLSVCPQATLELLFDLEQIHYIDRQFMPEHSDFELSVTLSGRNYIRSFKASRIELIVAFSSAFLSLLAAVFAFISLL